MTTVTCPQCGGECNALGTCPRCSDAEATTSLPPPSEVGTVVLDGRYRVEGLLGRGGMGAVYEGFDTSLNRRVAIKFLADPLRADPRIVQRFRREAEALAAVEHSAVVPIYSVGEQDGCPYFVMRYVEGKDLFRWTRELGRLSLAQVVHVGMALCDGLEQIHAAGFVHRDIKPANAMVQPDGATMVLDFGIMRTNGSELTHTGFAIGSPKFMAPEQGRDSRLADARSDLYGLGATLYYALTGNPPFSGSSDYEILAKHHQDPLTPPSRLVTDLPKSVDRFFATAMAKGPDDRFQSAREFRAGLVELAAPGWHVQATQPRRSRTPRGRWLLAATGVAIALVVVWARRPESPSPPLPDPRPAPAAAVVTPATPVLDSAALREPAPARRVPAPLGAAFLRIVTTEGGVQLWADIAVDGKSAGLSPITELKLSPGRHLVRATREGYTAAEQFVELRADERRKVTLELQRTP